MVLLGVWATLPAVEADGTTGSRTGVDRLDFAPMVSTVLTRPTPVKATDGRFHIVYEVLLTNNSPYPLGVDSLEVREARARKVLARLSGPALAANMGPVAGPPASTTDQPSNLNPAARKSEQTASDAATTMASSQTSAVWLDIKVRSARPRSLEHFIVASSRPPPGRRSAFSGLIGHVRTEGPRS